MNKREAFRQLTVSFFESIPQYRNVENELVDYVEEQIDLVMPKFLASCLANGIPEPTVVMGFASKSDMPSPTIHHGMPAFIISDFGEFRYLLYFTFKDFQEGILDQELG